MKIKAIAAIVALFFATSTFAQVAEPTTTSPSTTIPAKGQVPANTGGTTKQKGQKHAEGEKNHGQANPEGKRRHDESEAQTTGQAGEKGKKEHAEGDHRQGQSNPNGKAKHAEGDHKEGQSNPNGKAKHAEGDHKEGHGDKGKMKPAEGTATQPGTVQPKTLKAKKKAN